MNNKGQNNLFFSELRTQSTLQKRNDDRAFVYKERNERLQKICKEYNLITKGHVYHLKWNIYFHPQYQVKSKSLF